MVYKTVSAHYQNIYILKGMCISVKQSLKTVYRYYVKVMLMRHVGFISQKKVLSLYFVYYINN